MSHKLFFFLLFTLPLSIAHGQILDNGSLEGQVGTRTPINWESCLESSTVDVLPGLWGVTKPAQDGNTYINMVCRGLNFPDGSRYPNGETCEELAQVLNSPMISGKCYRVEMYMAFASDFGIIEFRNPINVRISGGTAICSRDEEIVAYEAIDHDEWRRYVSYFTPDQDLSTIWFEGEFNGLTSHFGHILIDNVKIEEVNAPEIREVILCENESQNLRAYLVEDAQGFNWSTGADTPDIEVTTAGTYTVDISLGECTVRETFEVTVQEALPVELTDDFLICPGEEITLNAETENASYLWQDGSISPSLAITDAGAYSVSLTIGDCVNQYNVTILEDNCEALLEMSNAFTPNGDGKNDLFTPIRAINIVSMQTVIYNRWGENIYTTKNLNIEWNGNFPNGEPAPPSTYYWRINYTDLTGETRNQKGTVTLVN